MKRASSLLLFIVAAAAGLSGADELPAIFSDHLVLQRDRPVRVWGRSEPGTEIRVSFAGGEATTRASATRDWMIELSALPASNEGRELLIEAEQTHRFVDVLVGDVWLMSGQSNMNWPLEKASNAEAEIADAALPALRLFQVGRFVGERAEFVGRGKWQRATAESASPFSAIGFLVGRAWQREHGVPVGVIQSTWGGTRIRAWLPWAVMETNSRYQSIIADWKRDVADFPRLKAEFEATLPERTAAWKEAVASAKREGRSPPYPPALRTGPGTHHQPGGLFAGMIAPVAPFALAGVAWYQGESDAGQTLYQDWLATLIESWRDTFRDERLPFVVVQLPNLRRGAEPRGGGWPIVREAQLKVSQQLPAVALVTTIDVGDPADVHPIFKQPVAARVKAAFEALMPGRDEPERRLAPVPTGYTHNDAGEIAIRFGPRGVRLVVSDAPGLVIAGEDRRFGSARWRIDGDTIVVWSPDVSRPESVRYAWGGNPVAGIFSEAGIPLSPFRLDDWADDSVVYSAEALSVAVRK